MLCNYCENEIPDEARFCPCCGRQNLHQKETETKTTPLVPHKNAEAPQRSDNPRENAEATQCSDEPRKSAEATQRSDGPRKSTGPTGRNGRPGKRLVLLLLVFLILGGGLFTAWRLLTDVDIVFDTSFLPYEETLDIYYLPDNFSGFRGELEGPRLLLRQVRFEVRDVYGTCISEGEASLSGNSWSIEKAGLLKGRNTLTVTASFYIGGGISRSLTVINTGDARLDGVSVDTTDEDGDGLIGYLEAALGTAPVNPDTDGDGLSDYVEISLTGTDPCRYATEDDGICDAERDSDRDRLVNRDELEWKTDPGNPDTDFDGLNDGAEITDYGTDPLTADTDSDGASDGWEAEHSYDPLVYNESFEVMAEANAAGSAVSAGATLSCHAAPEGLTIEPTRIGGLLDETLPGYLGSAYSFSYGGDFDSATIRMTFDRSRLSTGADPVIYYYNEETQELEELETRIEGDTAVATVTHFSTYILLDRTKVSRVIQEDILTPEEVDEILIHIAFVVDYSASMADNDPEYMRLKIVQEYIRKLRDGKDSATLVKFAGYATTLVPLSSDMKAMANATGSITNTGSDSCSHDDAGTNGSDGIRHALDELERSTEATYRYLIFLTDGEDTTQSYDYEELIAEAVAHQTVIYTIGMGDCDQKLLSHIAESTGGKFHYASSIDHDIDGELSLQEAMNEIENETIDYFTDSNEDGISDYYTRLICDGVLTTGTGSNPFGGVSYDDIQAGGADYDKDGLANGAEIVVSLSGETIHLTYRSSPIQADTDEDGHPDGDDARALLWDVGDRDLAIFAALAYEDGSAHLGKMYTAADIQGNSDESGERYYFLDFASLAEGGLDEAIAKDWMIVDYVNAWTPLDHFSATTFKCQDNIVIAYRGTNEGGEWVDNIVCYGMLNYHLEESYARCYARRIAAAYPQCRLYLTGHSLGGYLTQIGTAELLENTKVQPERVAYFNGIGMNFQDHSGVLQLLKPDQLALTSEVNQYFHLTDMEELSAYSESFGSLISYEISGDVVSALGTHCGQEIRFEATEAARRHHAGKYGDTDFSDWLGTVLTEFVSDITARDLTFFYEQYQVQSIMEYFWITHETDSFYYYLDQGTRDSSGG